MESHGDKLDKISVKIDKIADKLTALDVTTIKQQVILNEHIRRTELLEETVKPLSKHVNIMNAALKILGIVSTIAVIAEYVHSIAGKFK